MSSSVSKAPGSDTSVDLEKGAAAELKADDEQAVVHPRAMRVKIIMLDVIVTAYTLFLLGLIVWMAKVSNSWWDFWPALVILAVIFAALWMTSVVKESFVRKYAAMKQTESGDSDVTAKLLASNKK